MKLAVIGSGISGLSAFWLLAKKHDVTFYEKDNRAGGHSNTVILESEKGVIPVDTGFIVYNEKNYPNLVHFFENLGVATQNSEMSFSVSRNNGNYEYSGRDLAGLFAQPSILFRPRFWKILRDLIRFYKEGTRLAIHDQAPSVSLGEYLDQQSYSKAFIDDHLLPMAAAIWSAPVCNLKDYPLESFLRFCKNHGLLKLSNRPQWKTVTSGSVEYVQKILKNNHESLHLNTDVASIAREKRQVRIEDHHGAVHFFDQVVIATHADQALKLLRDPSDEEQRLLSKFKYQKNSVALHSDSSLMPKRRRAWSSWNFIDKGSVPKDDQLSVTYWMNRLQNLDHCIPLFVTLNPAEPPTENLIHRRFVYEHPIFNRETMQAQKELWNIQGVCRTWFCGSYFGSGFHEDGLQAGLAVAEALGSPKRPWRIEEESGRIHLPTDWEISLSQAA